MSPEILQCIIQICNFPIIYNTKDLSPKAIKKASRYNYFNKSIRTLDISKHIEKNPELINKWELFTEDIRHSPAWGFGKNDDETWSVAFLNDGELIREFKFKNKYHACAKMVKMTIESID